MADTGHTLNVVCLTRIEQAGFQLRAREREFTARIT